MIETCVICGNKIDPSKPETFIVGKKAHFTHRNCVKKKMVVNS